MKVILQNWTLLKSKEAKAEELKADNLKYLDEWSSKYARETDNCSINIHS
jgi:hypothetical protein